MGLPASLMVMVSPLASNMDLEPIMDPVGLINDPGYGTHLGANDFLGGG